MTTNRTILLGLAGTLAIVALTCVKSRQPATKLQAKSTYARAIVSGGLPVTEVGTAVRRSKGALRQCFAELRRAQPRASGKIVVDWFVQGHTGRVTKAKILQSAPGVSDRSFQDCVLGTVRAMRFGKMRRHQDTKVVYPLTFPLK